MAKTISKEIREKIVPNIASLNHKDVYITGGNSGIGLEVAKVAASYGARVYLLIRNLEKGKKAKEEILSLTPKAEVNLISLDVSEKSSVEECASYIISHHLNIDIFFQNAGVYHLPYQLTEEGFERITATNLIGPYRLAALLLPYMNKQSHKSRMVFQSSITMKMGRFDYDDFCSVNHFRKGKAYFNSKLGLVHIYHYLKVNNLYENVEFYLTHPGGVYTPLIVKAYPKAFIPVISLFMKTFFHSKEKAALSSLLALTTIRSGEVFIGPRFLSGYPKYLHLSKKVLKDSEKTVKTLETIADLKI